jgi:hypothetical protein
MKLITGLVLLILSTSVMAEIKHSFLCTNVNYTYIDSSRNEQLYYMKLNFHEDNYDMDLDIELFNQQQNPNETQGLKRSCFDKAIMSFNHKSYVCMDSKPFYEDDAVAIMSMKFDSFQFPRDTFLINFNDLDYSSSRYNHSILANTLRQMYCVRTEVPEL